MGEVLVIEDDKIIRDMISELVKISGHGVTAPEEMIEGLQYLITKPVHHKKFGLAIVQVHPQGQEFAVRERFIQGWNDRTSTP